jgi:hypothetical protein
MKKYKVIWFDDEFETLDLLREQAMLNGITLIGFSNAKDGILELEKNTFQYDAAIVDGKFFKNPEQSGDTMDDSALGDVARALDKLSDIKVLPWFILSGQISFTKEINSLARLYKDNVVYDKLNEEHLLNLWNDLKREAANQEDTQIRHKYKRVFEVCTKKYIGETANKDLLSILKKENSEKAFIDPNLYFNSLRKIMDDLFMAFNKYGVMPDVFVKPTVALNESSKFLSGSVEKGYKLDVAVFPKVVSDHVRSILAVCQPASHRSEIDIFISQVNTPYLLLSVTYQLLDVLLWFKEFIDSNTDIAFNKTKYNLVDTSNSSNAITGTIEQDESNNYHCGEIIINYTQFYKNGFKIGDTIRILKVANNTNELTMHLYPKRAVQTEKI